MPPEKSGTSPKERPPTPEKPRVCPPDGWELHPDDDLWPELVNEAALVGEVIYGVGDPTLLSEPCISIIGARRGTPYGLAVAELAGRMAAECGLVVVSGGAIGCDGAAARAAIEAGGRTIVVAGCGADRIYPKRHRDIFCEARASGAVLSLAPWGSEAHRFAFPVRNRLIAALSRALVVCEAGMPSGTFSTAQTAADLGRIIYAAPGSIFSSYSRGTNWLLEQGASIIVDDVSLEMAISCDYDVARLVQERTEERELGEVLKALIADPQRPDELAQRLDLDVITLLRTLGDYEASGLVTRLPDGCYAPTEQALTGPEDRARRRDDSKRFSRKREPGEDGEGSRGEGEGETDADDD